VAASAGTSTNRWSLPYIDQPLSFWNEIETELGSHVAHVYFPLPGGIIGSGRPPQADDHLEEFLRDSHVAKAVLLNAVTLPRPVNEVAPAVIEALRRLAGEFGIREAVVVDLLLARRVRDALPDLSLTASVLMEISEPYQARLLAGVCDTLVPASRVVRDLPALQALRRAFSGRIRLLVNEACLPGCPFRTQHFHEMASGVPEPKSLCVESLQTEPWLRLTGSWVLPQHLHHYDGIYDELKLAGRVTLQDPAKYKHVVRSYVKRLPLRPDEIGGGPASVLEPIEMSDELFAYTLTCGRRCHECTRCPDYYEQARLAVPRGRATEAQHHRVPVQTCW
jgi:collagenase-like PrtC family protease